jgi:hypothetical protein
MIRHLKIAYALETISFTTARRVGKKNCAEKREQIWRRKNKRWRKKTEKIKRKKSWLPSETQWIEDIDHCSRENKSGCAWKSVWRAHKRKLDAAIMSKRRKKIKLRGEIGRFSYFLFLPLLFYFYCFVLCRRVKAEKVAFLWRVRPIRSSHFPVRPAGLTDWYETLQRTRKLRDAAHNVAERSKNKHLQNSL